MAAILPRTGFKGRLHGSIGAIGVARSTSVMLSTYGTGRIADDQLQELVRRHFDLRPKGSICGDPADKAQALAADC